MLRLVLDDVFVFESQNRCSFHREGMSDHGLSKEGCNLALRRL